MYRKPRRSVLLVLSFVAIAVAIAGLQAVAARDVLRILSPREPAVGGWGASSQLRPIGSLIDCIQRHLSAPWAFDISFEFIAMETVTTSWFLERRMWDDLGHVAIVPLWLARELSERRQLIDIEEAPIIEPGYFRCDPWDPDVELPGWIRLVNINPVPYTDVTNPWACREGIRIPGTGEYVIVLLDPEGIYANPERYVCERTTIIRNTLELLRHCIAH